MTTTNYYNLNIVEGTDIVNPLTVDNPNYVKIDETMHDNAVAGVTLASEIANATVHTITRENSDCAVIRFIATSRWKAGDTATVDGVPVTALLPSGETLPDGAYVINANVLCILTGTILTVYAGGKKVENANEITYKDTNVGAELDELNGSVSTINKNLIRYNPNKDSLDVYYNGDFVGSIPCNFNKIYFKLDNDSTGWVTVKTITNLTPGTYECTIYAQRTDSGVHDSTVAATINSDGNPTTDYATENNDKTISYTRTFIIGSIQDTLHFQIYKHYADQKFSGYVTARMR